MNLLRAFRLLMHLVLFGTLYGAWRFLLMLVDLMILLTQAAISWAFAKEDVR